MFERLFSPISIGAMTIPNRIVMAPHAVVFSAGYGNAIDRVIDYHVERAKGGAGLIVMSNFLFPPSWQRLANWGGVLETSALGTLDRIDDPDLVPFYRRLISDVHAHGAKFISQLNASGRQLHSPGTRNFNIPLFAPSALPCPRTREIPRAMSVAEIEEYVEAFATSAQNVADAGGDGVELFAAQGYLLHEFLSPRTNLREDRYGGDLTGRMRFLLDSVSAIRRRVGSSLVIGVRINAYDDLEGGIDLPMAVAVARALAQAGVDYLNVSGLTSAAYPGWIADMTVPEAQFASAAGAIRAAVPGMPVSVSSRIDTPALAERILADGHADLIGLVRPLISDPEWPNKARRGLIDDIRLCTYSNQACLMGLDQGRGIGCVHNVAVGRERQIGIGTMRKAAKPRRVAVVGGGPGGMAAARIAGERGHDVTLFEAGERLGGQNLMTAAMASRRAFHEVTRWQAHMLRQMPVKIELETSASAAMLQAFDAVVLATGSHPRRDGWSAFRPTSAAMAGVQSEHVASVWDAFRRPDAIGRRVLVVDEDPHLSAAYVAEHLADCGREVAIVTPFLHAAPALHPDHVPALYRRLGPKMVEILAGTIALGVETQGVRVRDRHSGQERLLIGFDTIILGMGQVANRALEDELAGQEMELHLVGDCVTPRLITDAIMDGERAGWML
ncbi:FAD-dependent oxidoreductase [Xanthobacteraceae bacterium A53D]